MLSVVDPLQHHPERRSGFPLARQLRLVLPLLVVWGGGIVLLAIVAERDDAGRLLVDPAYAAGGLWYDGFISELGILAWSVAAVSAAWGGWLALLHARRGAAAFLRSGAVVSGALLLNDLFDIHAIATRSRAQKITAVLAIAVFVLVWVSRSWKEIRRTRHVLLTASLLANALSIAVDVLARPNMDDRMLIVEDGAKFLGILAWAAYFVVTSAEISRAVLAAARMPQGVPLAHRQRQTEVTDTVRGSREPLTREPASAVG